MEHVSFEKLKEKAQTAAAAAECAKLRAKKKLKLKKKKQNRHDRLTKEERSKIKKMTAEEIATNTAANKKLAEAYSKEQLVASFVTRKSVAALKVKTDSRLSLNKALRKSTKLSKKIGEVERARRDAVEKNVKEKAQQLLQNNAEYSQLSKSLTSLYSKCI